jgi:hypothetical protein
MFFVRRFIEDGTSILTGGAKDSTEGFNSSGRPRPPLIKKRRLLDIALIAVSLDRVQVLNYRVATTFFSLMLTDPNIT